MKKTVNIFLIVFLISFQLKSFAGEKNYHKELITDWSRIFPDKNRNAAGPKFFKYIIDKKITYKDFKDRRSVVFALHLVGDQDQNIIGYASGAGRPGAI